MKQTKRSSLLKKSYMAQSLISLIFLPNSRSPKTNLW